MINVLIADDHTMFVDGIESILGGEPDFFVVGRSHDGPSVLSFLENHQVDIILLDINLPEMSGIDVCKYIHTHHRYGV